MEKRIIKKAHKILDNVGQEYKHHDKDIMQGIDGEKRHARDVLKWVKKLNSKASLSLKLAALFHDIDRIVTAKVGGGFKGKRGSQEYLKHKKRHAKRSADFIIPLLKEYGVSSSILKNTEFLIIHHDDTGKEIEKINNMNLNYLVAADSLSFYSTIAPKLYKIEGEERIKDKIRFMVDKMPQFARKILTQTKLKNKIFENYK